MYVIIKFVALLRDDTIKSRDLVIVKIDIYILLSTSGKDYKAPSMKFKVSAVQGTTFEAIMDSNDRDTAGHFDINWGLISAFCYLALVNRY